jgi:hypothetical protein
MRNEQWRLLAACRGLPTAIFFPEHASEVPDPYDDARKICVNCPVKDPCLEIAEAFSASGDRNGMFGGLSPAERQTFRRRQRSSLKLRKSC